MKPPFGSAGPKVGFFNFGVAMDWVLKGYRVRRRDWNRVCFIQRGVVKFDVEHSECIQIVMKDGRTNTYTASQCDMLGEDWYRYDLSN